MLKTKNCLACGKDFTARKDAKTCSVRCRKRLQRHKQALVADMAPPRFNWRRAFFLLAFLAVLALPLYRAAALTEGYGTNDSGLKQGMLVALGSESTSGQRLVERADYKHPEKVLGIAVGMKDTLLTFASPATKVFVATSGQAQAYVSDINGQPKKGDNLSLSPIAGILMKSNESTQGIAGVALADFPGSAQSLEAKDSRGKPVSVKLSLMPININLVLPAGGGGQGWLSYLGRSVTGHDVGSTRVISALGIFIILLVIEGSMIYATISRTITAIGRNPLASKQIVLQSLRSFGLAVVFLLIGGSVISIILWL